MNIDSSKSSTYQTHLGKDISKIKNKFEIFDKSDFIIPTSGTIKNFT